jgi:hypothetical protein
MHAQWIEWLTVPQYGLYLPPPPSTSASATPATGASAIAARRWWWRARRCSLRVRSAKCWGAVAVLMADIDRGQLLRWEKKSLELVPSGGSGGGMLETGQCRCSKVYSPEAKACGCLAAVITLPDYGLWCTVISWQSWVHSLQGGPLAPGPARWGSLKGQRAWRDLADHPYPRHL